MNLKKKLLLLTIILSAGLLLTACPQRTSIGKIEANPSKYVGKESAIAGRVTDSYGLAMLGGAYKVDDGTGSIWVISSRSVPSKNSYVGVKGDVQNGGNFGGRNYGLVIMENDRRIK